MQAAAALGVSAALQKMLDAGYADLLKSFRIEEALSCETGGMASRVLIELDNLDDDLHLFAELKQALRKMRIAQETESDMVVVCRSAAGEEHKIFAGNQTSLRDLQEELCSKFKKPFPNVKCELIVCGKYFDDFIQLPFENCDGCQGHAEIIFQKTDDPYPHYSTTALVFFIFSHGARHHIMNPF